MHVFHISSIDLEQDMKIALLCLIVFTLAGERFETFRSKPQVTQCYQCQGLKYVANEYKNECLRCT